MQVIVAGGRRFKDYLLLERFLDHCLAEEQSTCLRLLTRKTCQHVSSTIRGSHDKNRNS